MRLLFTILFFGSFLLQINAQEKTINGRIILDMDEGFGEDIYITNSRTNLTTVTDATGAFKIKAMAGDHLLIQSINYENRRFTLNETVMNMDMVTIHLNLQAIVLDDAIITRKLTGYLDKDAKYNPKLDPLNELYKELGVNRDASKLRDSSDFQLGKDISILHLNVEKMLEVFTGDLRRRQNLYTFEGREAKIEHIQNYFGEDYFIDELGLPKEKIRDFIFYAYGSSGISALYDQNNFLGIMIEFNKLAPLYLNRLQSWYTQPDKS